jgi:isoquinoline 1-oxidoreductase subunit beta
MSPFDTLIERRTVLKGFLIAGPTLAVAARLGLADGANAFPTKTDEVPDAADFTDTFIATQQPTIYDLLIEVRPDGTVYAELPKMDIGQGIIGAFAIMVADNLDVPYEKVEPKLGKADQKWNAAQITGGSHNVRVLWDPVRVVGARMRGQLMAAGSEKLGVPVAQLRTEDGYVVARDGRKVGYGELTARAAQLTNARAAAPKKASEFKVIGKPQVKHDIDKIVQGKFPYPLDYHSSKEFLPTVVALAATHGASVVSIDDSEAKKIPGVIAVTHVPGMPDYLIPEAVAVTAETFGIAKKAKNALKIKWSAGPMDALSDAQIDDVLNGIIDQVAVPGEGVEATFRWPYVPHAPMEENSSVCTVTAEGYEGWGGAQVPTTLQRQLAETLGMQVEQILYHCVPAGGAFGRHLFHDQDVQAAQVSQRLGKPIKMQWLREEGIKHGRTRPVSIHKVKATIANGDVVAWQHNMACPEMDLRHGLGDIAIGLVTEYNNEGACQTFWAQTQKMPYKTGPTTYNLKQKLLAKPTAAWRVVYSGQVHGKDELEFRISLADTERHRQVLTKVGEMANWGKQLPAGVAQGIGLHDEYKSVAAYIMTIDVRGREPRMTECYIAVDNGFCVNPTGTASSLLGQAHDGFAVVFRSGLHVDNGATRESTPPRRWPSRSCPTPTSRPVASASWVSRPPPPPRPMPGLGPQASRFGTSRSTSTEPDRHAHNYLQSQWQPGFGRR